jgi:UDP-2-acetamido-2-deoxy-ribo-hexuluronate aminotransferase
MRKIRAHGQERRYHHSHLGINGRLDTLQAAILLAKFDRFDWEVSRRKYIGSAYSAKIANQCPWVKTPLIDSCNTSVYSQYTIQLDSRDEISRKLNQVGIPTAVYYPIPLHRQPVFSELNLTQTSLDISEAVAPRVLSLPMGADLDEEVQNCIVSALREATISHSEKLTT